MAAAALGFACVETTAPLAPPEELLLVVNTGDATLSVVPLIDPTIQVRVGLGSAVPGDARPAAGRLFAVVAAGGGDSLAVVDLRQRRLEAMIFLGAGAGALGAVVIGDTAAIVALSTMDSVARVNFFTGEITRARVGHFPKDLALARGKLFVVNANVDPCPPPDNQCPVGESWVTVLDPVRLTPVGGRDSIPLPGPGNASYAAVGTDGRIYVLSAGGPDAPAGRLSIVDPVTQAEVGSFGGFGDHPGPIAADRGERILVSSPTEGLMEFNTRTRSVVRGAGNAIPVLFNRGVAADSRNSIYGIEAGPCTGGASGRVRIFRPDFTEASTAPLGPCARAATIALIPPQVDASAR